MPRSMFVGPYRILRLINQGGQGTVYLGFDDRLQRRVAIKIVRLPADKKARRGLLREAKVVASIASSKVVQIYDLIVANDHMALIMEYVPGCDLEEFLQNEKPSMASILAVCIDISGALAAARQQQIVHGDVKASNILITAEGRVKLTDFGVARTKENSKLSMGGGGSLTSVSPEQYLGRPLDVRSDLFSLGCLLYRMLAGEHPFMHSGEFDGRALLEKAPRPLEEMVPSAPVPEGLSELLESLLQKRPEDRPRNTHQVRNALREISKGIPLSVGNTLLREAENSFRLESAQDIPPSVPADLTRRGLSSLKPARSGIGAMFQRGEAKGLILATVLGASVMAYAMLFQQLPIVLTEPSLTISNAAELPHQVSSGWLVEVIGGTLPSASYSIAGVHEPTYYSEGLRPRSKDFTDDAAPRIHSSLHCVKELCLLGLVLENKGRRSTQQKLIITSMPITQWSDIVRSASRELLAHKS
jgi:serine/threonine protein kinase